MTEDEMTRRHLRVEFTKAIITGAAGHESPYVNYAQPEKKIAKRAWELGNALAEMEMKKREEERAEDVRKASTED